MKREHLPYILCPKCRVELGLTVGEMEDERIKSGVLECGTCEARYNIREFIPRMVPSEENYAEDFGFQWNLHDQTQVDSANGLTISGERFFNETRWPREMKGALILEAGCGSGRFTEHAITTGAMVISFDYSRAVEANYRNNGKADNLLIVQADIFQPPFEAELFDRVFCIGVLQHTPAPQKAFQSLVRLLKRGGNIVIDNYELLPGWKKWFETKYWARPLTSKLPTQTLYKLCRIWVSLTWPICTLSYMLTGRRTLSWFLLTADYRGVYPLSKEQHKEWALLDTFDMLAPEYDFPETPDGIRSWFDEAGLVDVEVGLGYNGIEGRGSRSPA
jgi:SAM-dependent methyltransferase